MGLNPADIYTAFDLDSFTSWRGNKYVTIENMKNNENENALPISLLFDLDSLLRGEGINMQL
jgi:hypothetical protein